MDLFYWSDLTGYINIFCWCLIIASWVREYKNNKNDKFNFFLVMIGFIGLYFTDTTLINKALDFVCIVVTLVVFKMGFYSEE